MPRRGNWGDWAVIDLPPAEKKHVSCYACKYYYREDGSCIKTSIIPRKDGNKNAWKYCTYFELDSEYMTYPFMETVRSVKGNDFFVSKKERMESELEKNEKDASTLICDYEIGSWIKSVKYGTGRLIEAYPGKVVIDFQGKQRTFVYPESFDRCLLFLVYPPNDMEYTKIPSETKKSEEKNQSSSFIRGFIGKLRSIWRR